MGNKATMLPFDLDDLLPSHHVRPPAQESAELESADLMQQTLDFDMPGDDAAEAASLNRQQTLFDDDADDDSGTISTISDDALVRTTARPHPQEEPKHHYIVGGVEVHDVELIPDEDPAEQLALNIPVLPPPKAAAESGPATNTTATTETTDPTDSLADAREHAAESLGKEVPSPARSDENSETVTDVPLFE